MSKEDAPNYKEFPEQNTCYNCVYSDIEYQYCEKHKFNFEHVSLCDDWDAWKWKKEYLLLHPIG